MINTRKVLVLAASLGALAACAKTAAPDATADQAAIRAVSIAWKNAYNAGDAAAVAALYAEDAVLSAPGERALRGSSSIAEYFAKKVAEFSAAGLTVADAPMGAVGTSGDLGFQWETYRVTDKSGGEVDAGKLLTLFGRKNGKWMIIGDTWNSDAPAGAPAARATVVVAAASNSLVRR
jgi:uncharacterized protein (TIGR02246 family)